MKDEKDETFVTSHFLQSCISLSELSLSSPRRQFIFYPNQFFIGLCIELRCESQSFFRSLECTNPSFDEVAGTFHKRLELSLADRRQRNA